MGSISYIQRLRQLREELLCATDPAQREDLLERMLFLVENQSRARRAGAAAGNGDSAALNPQPLATGSLPPEDAGPNPEANTEPEDPT